MIHSPRTNRSLQLGAALISMLLTAGCAQSGTNLTEANNLYIPLKEIEATPSSIDCVETVIYEDDLYFPDTARGFECLQENGSHITFRAYENEQSVEFALQDWLELITDDTFVTLGANWFLIGPSNVHTQFSDTHSLIPAFTANPHITVNDLPREDQIVRSCMIGAVSLIREKMVPEFAGALDNPDSYNQYFPGMAEVVNDVVVEMKRNSETLVPFEFEVSVTEYGGVLKHFCRERSENFD